MTAVRESMREHAIQTPGGATDKRGFNRKKGTSNLGSLTQSTQTAIVRRGDKINRFVWKLHRQTTEAVSETQQFLHC